jgi:hypothetical protein
MVVKNQIKFEPCITAIWNKMHRIFIVYSSYIHRIFIVYSSYIHRIFIVYSSYIHRIFIVYSSFIHKGTYFLVNSVYFVRSMVKLSLYVSDFSRSRIFLRRPKFCTTKISISNKFNATIRIKCSYSESSSSTCLLFND